MIESAIQGNKKDEEDPFGKEINNESYGNHNFAITQLTLVKRLIVSMKLTCQTDFPPSF